MKYAGNSGKNKHRTLQSMSISRCRRVCVCEYAREREEKKKVCVRVCASAFSSVLMKYALLIFQKYRYLCTSPGLNNKKKMRFELAKDKKKIRIKDKTKTRK